MKGLYVYGALLMALSFVTGVVQGNGGLCALAIASCALAALSEVITEIGMIKVERGVRVSDALAFTQGSIALLSWLCTAVTSLFAIISLI